MLEDDLDNEAFILREHNGELTKKHAHNANYGLGLHVADSNAIPNGKLLLLNRRQGRTPGRHGVLTAPKTSPVTIFGRGRRKKRRDIEEDTLFNLQQGATWLAYRLVGGIRGDPFNALPDDRDCIPYAIDHFVQIFIPERILRPFGAVPEIESLAHDYFQLVIHDKCVFEATVAQAQASLVASQGIRKPTKEILHHNGKALVLLSEKLADPVARLDDSVIHAILAIMGTHFFFMELDQHQAHLDGMWEIIRMRGGIETLGSKGTLRQAVETVTSFRAYHTKLDTPVPTPEPDSANTKSAFALDYPSHPFPPSVTSMITKLPDGFCDLALKCTLSTQLIDLISNLQEKSILNRNDEYSESPKQPKRHIYEADKCVEILKSPDMPELERMICGGLLAYVVHAHITPTTRLDTEPRNTIYDEPLQNMMLELSQYIYFNYEGGALLWVIYCFAALQKHILQDYRADFFHHNILRFRQSSRWLATETSLKKFLWTQDILDEWKKNWEEARTNQNATGGTPASTPSLTRGSKSPRSSQSPPKNLGTSG